MKSAHQVDMYIHICEICFAYCVVCKILLSKRLQVRMSQVISESFLAEFFFQFQLGAREEGRVNMRIIAF